MLGYLDDPGFFDWVAKAAMSAEAVVVWFGADDVIDFDIAALVGQIVGRGRPALFIGIDPANPESKNVRFWLASVGYGKAFDTMEETVEAFAAAYTIRYDIPVGKDRNNALL
jgi:hypothetical protein